ncbi:MAG: DapH/DapD/GlmU-related protein [Acidobacteriota bacterium]|jgi:serine O-acetyltransferase
MGALGRDVERLRLTHRGSTVRVVVEALLFDNGFQAVFLYRIARWLKVRNVRFLAPLVARVNLWLTGVDVNPGAEIGPGLRISHGTGMVIGGAARIGEDALILHGVTVGSLSPSRRGEMPVIGDRAFLGAGAAIVGGIRLGDDVVVGPNAVVTEDVPDGSRVVSAAGIRVTPRGPKEA